jgi:Leucine-rich repeat (LRR) protein
LEVLDLSGNDLTRVEGLNELGNLKFLNLSGNGTLDLPFVLENLKEHERLEQISFGVLEENINKNLWVKNKKYREKVLLALLFKNPNLKWLDNVQRPTIFVVDFPLTRFSFRLTTNRR